MLNPQIPVVLSTLSSEPEMGEAVKFLLAGFTVVVATLLSLAAITAIVGWIFRTFPALAGTTKAPASKSASPVPADEVDGPLMAAIGTAVDQALGGRYRICSVKPTSK